MNRFLGNAFSLQMTRPGLSFFVREIPAGTVRLFLDRTSIRSVVGHADTAAVLSTILGHTVEHNRESISLEAGDQLIVAQLQGGRLPEGARTLPEGARFQFLLVEVSDPIRKDYEMEFSLNSIYGALLRHGETVASLVGGTARPCQDASGNFIVEITGRGFHGELHDD